MWSYYGSVCRCYRPSVSTICGRIMVGFVVVVVCKWTQYEVVLCLGLSLLSFVSKHNMWSYYYWVRRCCRHSVNTICGVLWLGLSLLLSVIKHTMWPCYGWVFRCCRPSVSTIVVYVRTFYAPQKPVALWRSHITTPPFVWRHKKYITRSSSIRRRATVAEVTGWRFTFPSWDPPNFSIRWETHRKRITAVSPTSWSSTDHNTTTVRLKSNPTTPTPADCIACTTSNGDIEEWNCRT